MTTERTLVLVKPDGVQRGLTGEIIGRLERTGLQIIGMKLMQISDELASTHYGEHEGKPFYAGDSPKVNGCDEPCRCRSRHRSWRSGGRHGTKPDPRIGKC